MERFLYAKLHGQAVGVPSGFSVNLKALHGLVAAEKVFDGARHHMVYAGHTVCRRRTFVKNKRRSPLAQSNTLLKEALSLP